MALTIKQYINITIRPLCLNGTIVQKRPFKRYRSIHCEFRFIFILFYYRSSLPLLRSPAQRIFSLPDNKHPKMLFPREVEISQEYPEPHPHTSHLITNTCLLNKNLRTHIYLLNLLLPNQCIYHLQPLQDPPMYTCLLSNPILNQPIYHLHQNPLVDICHLLKCQEILIYLPPENQSPRQCRY